MSRPKAPDDTKLQSLAKELAKNVKSQKDLSDLTSKFVKMTIEAALNSEMEEHLGYGKNSLQGHNTGTGLWREIDTIPTGCLAANPTARVVHQE